MKKKGLDKSEQKLIGSVDQVGWHVMKVLEDDKGPGFAYSIGLYKTFKHPEIIIVGLKLDLAHILINDIGESIKSGKIYDSGNFYTDILDDFECLMVTVNKKFYKEYVGYGRWYYEGDDFPIMQCVYPTIKGVFPWEEKWPKDLSDLQPVLGNR